MAEIYAKSVCPFLFVLSYYVQIIMHQVNLYMRRSVVRVQTIFRVKSLPFEHLVFKWSANTVVTSCTVDGRVQLPSSAFQHCRLSHLLLKQSHSCTFVDLLHDVCRFKRWIQLKGRKSCKCFRYLQNRSSNFVSSESGGSELSV